MISVVVPAYNEAESLPQLYDEIKASMKQVGHQFQLLLVNDGSTDTTSDVIKALHKQDPKRVIGIELRHNSGKAAALHAGFLQAQGDLILTLDADLQDDPGELHKLLDKLGEGYDLISGWKQNRRDSFIKNKTSKVFNYFTNRISKAKLHDFNCGYKLYRAHAIKGINLYGELHRYIPVLVAAKGYRVTEVGVTHRERLHGKTKYGPIRFINGGLDLITVLFITRFRSRPLHLFGYVGLMSTFLGVITGLYLVYTKFADHMSIGTRPLLLLAVLFVIVGIQITVTGIVGEQLAALIHDRQPGYEVAVLLKSESDE